MINERGIWMTEDEIAKHLFDESLASTIYRSYNPQSVADIGCGDGRYTMYFLNKGWLCWGYDGSPLTPIITRDICHTLDFSKPQDIGQFELVISLEVGEHIPADYEQIFIDNLCNAANHYICLSWAVVGQGGTGHVNCRDNWYVIKELRNRGFDMDIELTKKLREASTLPWFKNTIMSYIKIN